MTFNKIREKYNGKGFNIKGLWLDELGCLASNWQSPAPMSEQIRYMDAFYRDTLIKVLEDDWQVISDIEDSPHARWIGPDGPDAHSGVQYKLGMCKWQDPGEGSDSGAQAVKAIQSLTRVAWFSIHPGLNHLFEGKHLSELGRHYFNACKRLRNTIGEDPPEVPPSPDCHTARPGSLCYEHAHWAKYDGFPHHKYEWYPKTLTEHSTVKDFQMHLHKIGHGECPAPCN